MKSYISQASTEHLQQEETQWAAILEKGDSYAGIILVYSQKLCTTAHEIGCAIHEGKISVLDIPFYAKRLQERLRYLIQLLQNSEISCVKDFQDMEKILQALITNPSERFYDIPEQIHAITHKLSDELTKIISKN